MIDLPPGDADFWVWMAHPVWRRGPEIEAQLYAGFNLLEALAWWAIGAWALVRYARWRRSPVELLYVAMFALFGFSDVLEAHAVTGWLLLAKGLIFANLVTARLYLVRVCYPGARL